MTGNNTRVSSVDVSRPPTTTDAVWVSGNGAAALSFAWANLWGANSYLTTEALDLTLLTVLEEANRTLWKKAIKSSDMDIRDPHLLID